MTWAMSFLNVQFLQQLHRLAIRSIFPSRKMLAVILACLTYGFNASDLRIYMAVQCVPSPRRIFCGRSTAFQPSFVASSISASVPFTSSATCALPMLRFRESAPVLRCLEPDFNLGIRTRILSACKRSSQPAPSTPAARFDFHLAARPSHCP